ncbi:MBL fold metallo-hydrolase [Patescibacteria group bacterium]|nr:MBL fold metallo-hydrolase [Patescibacteria group bacterium]
MVHNDKNIFILTFHGGAGTVTGANFLFEGPKGSQQSIRILVDCGIQQSFKFCDDCNLDTFPYDPSTIDILFITHAHLDHIGRIPKLVRDGFHGIIYSTPGTFEITAVMLEDSLGILTREAAQCGVSPLYSKEDVEEALSLWKTISYHNSVNLKGGVVFNFKDAGHILGSAMIELTYNDKKIVFTGDLGNSPTPLLRDTEIIEDADYLVMESVYGDRNHEPAEERTRLFQTVIEDTVARKGVLLIPAFSIERTQILLYELNTMIEQGRVKSLPVYLDSPLAIAVTDIYNSRIQNFNLKVQEEIKKGDDVFDFPQLKFTYTTEESRAIARTANPKIIIAGSGMSHGGRIIRHEKKYLPDPNSTLLFVGYQAAGSLGRRLQDGAKKVTIYDETIPVRARIETIRGYSAHKDSDGLVSFVESTSKTVKQIFVAMGEPKASLFLVQRLRDYVGVNAIAPKQGERFELEF